MPGPDFDPQDTRAEPMRIREQAQGFARVSGRLTGQQDSLSFVLRSLASSFSEVLHPLIRDRIGSQFSTLQDVVGALLYAEQVTLGWAEDVVVFKRQRDELVQRWELACANGFWITRAAGYDNVEPEMRETLYDDARWRVWTQLSAEAEVAYAALSIAAEGRGRQFSDGPTVANVLAVMGSAPGGGAGMAIVYRDLPVTGPRYGLPRQYWGMTPEQVLRAVEDDPELAALLVARRPSLTSADPFEAALAQAAYMLRGDESGSAYGEASSEQAAAVAQALAGIPAEELAMLAALFPAVVGNLNGMPFEHRISANRVRVADALHQTRAERPQAAAAAALAAARVPTYPGYADIEQTEADAAQQRLADLDARIEQYELLLDEPTVDYGHPDGPPWPDYRGRKLVYFDPREDGGWAELVGTISTETDAVGVLVPGVGTDAADMWNSSNTATGFVEQAAREGEQLAMIVWAGGDFPDGVTNALTNDYAEDLVEPLVDFSYAVQQEIDEQGPGVAVPVTVIGHSYGGLTVAMSTTSGLSADNLLFVNSPGIGAEPMEVLDALDEYETYAMMAPWDVVPYGGPAIHGISPAAIESVVELDTGTYADGTEINGSAGHSGVFEVGSTAWENMLAVLLGQPVLVD
ncbi:MAG: alpha/beta hydrolase [Geodermatophilaceae bacterium]